MAGAKKRKSGDGSVVKLRKDRVEVDRVQAEAASPGNNEKQTKETRKRLEEEVNKKVLNDKRRKKGGGKSGKVKKTRVEIQEDDDISTMEVDGMIQNIRIVKRILSQIMKPIRKNLQVRGTQKMN